MTVEEAIHQRRSIRHYLPDPVSPVVVRELLAAASMAPNVSNRQMWRFIAILTPELRTMLANMVTRQLDHISDWAEMEGQAARLRSVRESLEHFAAAPAVIAVIKQEYRHPLDGAFVQHGMRAVESERLFSLPDVQSIGGLIGYLLLLAEERGLGTCWMTDPLIAKKDLHAALELKAGEEIMAFVTMGKPAETPLPRPRKHIDEIIEWR